jgi:hypothetical protein
LNNTFSFNIGGQLRLYRDFTMGLRYLFQQAATDESGTRNEVALDLIYRISKRYKIHTYSMTGLSSGSADLATGIQLSARF